MSGVFGTSVFVFVAVNFGVEVTIMVPVGDGVNVAGSVGVFVDVAVLVGVLVGISVDVGVLVELSTHQTSKADGSWHTLEFCNLLHPTTVPLIPTSQQPLASTPPGGVKTIFLSSALEPVFMTNFVISPGAV